MGIKKKLRKIALWLFIVSVVCFPLLTFFQSLLKAYPVILNLVNILLMLGLVGCFWGSIIVFFISLFNGEKHLKSKTKNLYNKKDIDELCPRCGDSSRRVKFNTFNGKKYCYLCAAYYKNRFDVKNGELIEKKNNLKIKKLFDDSKFIAVCLIKQEQKYKSIEDALEILQKDNYVLQNIRTSGEFSSHDFVAPFSHEYSSVDELKRCANDDFDKEKKNTGPEIDWSTTIFTVKNKDTDFKISFYYGEYSDSSHLSAFITKDTKSYWDDVVEKLSSLIEEKTKTQTDTENKKTPDGKKKLV